jgi:hypothetical protein
MDEDEDGATSPTSPLDVGKLTRKTAMPMAAAPKPIRGHQSSYAAETPTCPPAASTFSVGLGSSFVSASPQSSIEVAASSAAAKAAADKRLTATASAQSAHQPCRRRPQSAGATSLQAALHPLAADDDGLDTDDDDDNNDDDGSSTHNVAYLHDDDDVLPDLDVEVCAAASTPSAAPASSAAAQPQRRSFPEVALPLARHNQLPARRRPAAPRPASFGQNAAATMWTYDADHPRPTLLQSPEPHTGEVLIARPATNRANTGAPPSSLAGRRSLATASASGCSGSGVRRRPDLPPPLDIQPTPFGEGAGRGSKANDIPSNSADVDLRRRRPSEADVVDHSPNSRSASIAGRLQARRSRSGSMSGPPSAQLQLLPSASAFPSPAAAFPIFNWGRSTPNSFFASRPDSPSDPELSQLRWPSNFGSRPSNLGGSRPSSCSTPNEHFLRRFDVLNVSASTLDSPRAQPSPNRSRCVRQGPSSLAYLSPGRTPSPSEKRTAPLTPSTPSLIQPHL